jgi:phospholipid transport system substrate-binding protein
MFKVDFPLWPTLPAAFSNGTAHINRQALIPMVRGVLALLALSCLSTTSRAEVPEAEAFVKTHTEAFQARLVAEEDINAADQAHLIATAEALVMPNFNFAAMSQRALGRHWREASDDQKKRFVVAFRTLLLKTYAGTVNDHRHDEIKFLPSRKLSDKAWRVRTQVIRKSGGSPFLIDYEVHQEPTGWRVYDVTVEGVSLAVSYRAGLAKDIAALGLDAVVSQMENRASGKPG